MGADQIPAEWIDCTDEELAALKSHWSQTLEDHGLGDDEVDWVLTKILDILKLTWEIYSHYAKKGAVKAENAGTASAEASHA
jgi:hypothetical protein